MKSAMRSQSDIANNEKYCSFAQTLESDEPIKLVAQIKTNYNVSVQDDEIGPGNLLSRNRQKRIYFRAIHVAGDLSHRNYRQMRCNAKKKAPTQSQLQTSRVIRELAPIINDRKSVRYPFSVQ